MASNSMFFGDRCFDDLLNRFLIIFDQNGSKRCCIFVSLFFDTFRIPFSHTSTFYICKTYKCPKPRFPIFFKKLKECIHTCAFYHFKEKTKCKKPKTSNAPRHDFGATFASVGTLVVPFWFHLGRVGSYFCSILNLLRSVFAHVGSLLVLKSLKELFGTLSAKHPEKIPGTLTFAPHRP